MNKHSFRNLSNTIEVNNPFTIFTVDLDEDFSDIDTVRAFLDLSSILSFSGVDAFKLNRFQIPNAGYGLMIKEQLPALIDRLKQDSESRRGSLTFWDGQGSPPCTLSADFKIREGKISAVFFQRSTDVLQLRYDLYNFVGITKEIACKLDITEGEVSLITTSLHDYKDR